MINKEFDVLKNWMFGSLSSLLDKTPPNPNLNILKMSIGEPQLGPPKFIRKQFDKFFKLLSNITKNLVKLQRRRGDIVKNGQKFKKRSFS